jgi:hypothetical protein
VGELSPWSGPGTGCPCCRAIPAQPTHWPRLCVTTWARERAHSSRDSDRPMEPLSRRAVLKGRRNDVTMISEEEEVVGAILERILRSRFVDYRMDKIVSAKCR